LNGEVTRQTSYVEDTKMRFIRQESIEIQNMILISKYDGKSFATSFA